MNMYKIILIIGLILSGLCAINPEVSGIDITGLKVTKEFIIRREIHHPVDGLLDSLLALDDRNRIDNLGIFASVEWKAHEQADGSVRIEYNVTESWPRIVPTPYPNYDEKLGWSYGMLLVVRNFQGRNQNLILIGQVGGRALYGFNFSDPWITGDHVSMSINAGNIYYAHSYLDYDISASSIQINLGRYFGYKHRISGGFEVEKKSFLGIADTLNLFYFAPEFNYSYDTRDIYLSPTKGFRMNQRLRTMVDFGHGGNRAFWTQSFSYYHSIFGGSKNMVVALNAASRVSIGDKKNVYQVYIGTSSTVRGWRPATRTMFNSGDQYYRFGHHWITSSLELRQTVIPKTITRWKTEFGLAVVGFLDIGFASDAISSLVGQPPMLGTGIGIRINWPWVGMFRLDYGLGYRDGEYIENYLNFSTGQKF